MDVNGKPDGRTTVPQGKHTGTHRLEVCVGLGNELSVWEKRRYLACGRKRASGQKNMLNAKHET
jgi:hypothetical protein